MKAQFFSDKTVGELEFDTRIKLQSDQDFIMQPESGASLGNNGIALGEGTSSFTDNSFAEGEYTIAGTRSFRIVSGDAEALTWTLKTTTGIRKGMQYSVRLLNNYDGIGTVVSVLDGTTISVDEFPAWSRFRPDEKLGDSYLSGLGFDDRTKAFGVRGHSSRNTLAPYTYTPEYATLLPPDQCFVDFDFDANSMWLLGHPEIGDLSSYATAAHSEGYQTMAQMQYSHAEGDRSVAVGKYAHAEGRLTFAGWSAHSEGHETSAFGNASHAEGYQTMATGGKSHASGSRAVVSSGNSYAWSGQAGSWYYDNGAGTFNVDPVGGANGFFIGTSSLVQIVRAEIEQQGGSAGAALLRIENAIDSILQ